MSYDQEMTDATVNIDIGPEPLTEEKAPEGHYFVAMKDRRILVKNINPAQSMVLGGYQRQINGEVNYDKITDIFGKIMQLVENLIVKPEDLAFLETKILDGEILIEDFAQIFHSHATGDTKPVAAKKPRRGK